MLILIVNGDEYKLNAKNQEALKIELLGAYPDDAEVKITDYTGKIYDELKLMDLFNTK